MNVLVALARLKSNIHDRKEATMKHYNEVRVREANGNCEREGSHIF